ncbi:DUF2510 domain-containing protein [Subtercola lobariae]|uniref:DUF2510 domain-containing protein n=1 Tax=Subtercola lobariae TaxID=1588641 RepID=A0A917F0Z0_9MICO|nr:DUF2510 domain-containing protein [Subtercola lobariae]GGF37488.1 hypothetical protein GCM10011399_33050 [Subtercola lobariae]
MSNEIPPAGGAAPAGWYPDGSGASIQRWWNGSAWTDHVYDTAASVYTAPEASGGVRLGETVPANTPYNAFIWVVALLPVLSIIGVLSWNMTPFFTAIFAASSTRLGNAAVYSSLGAGYYALVAIGWVTYIGTVVFAYLDYRRLGRQGLARRFHWAWSFLYGITYMIGRTVVVRSQLRAGMRVLWVYVGLLVVSGIVGIVKVSIALAAVGPLISHYW